MGVVKDCGEGAGVGLWGGVRNVGRDENRGSDWNRGSGWNRGKGGSGTLRVRDACCYGERACFLHIFCCRERRANYQFSKPRFEQVITDPSMLHAAGGCGDQQREQRWPRLQR